MVSSRDRERAIELNAGSGARRGDRDRDTEIGSNAHLNLGDSYLALGRLAEAEGHFQSVERVVRNRRAQDRWTLWRYAQHLFHSCAELALARGDSPSALAYADECLAKAEATNSPKNIVKARRVHGQVFLIRSQLAEAQAELDRALKLARTLANPPLLWQALVVLGDLRAARGSQSAALRACREA